ncbi:MAG: FHA domain-containing protein [Polyangiaceae bacterium]|nr:FHA domain-containing protein [Polyangiaceae bacterium]
MSDAAGPLRSSQAFHAPAAGPSPGHLVVIAQDGSPGISYPLSTPATEIGRTQGNVVLPNDPYISPLHARITYRNQRFWVEDLGSENGIYLRLTSEQELVAGDLVLVGLEVLRFEVVDPQERTLTPAARQGAQIFGSPVCARYARLTQQTMEAVTRDVYYLTREETIIGRESGDIVFTGDPYMSRRHARILRGSESGPFVLKDLGSSNGTYLRIRGETELSNRDYIRVGQHLFRLEVQTGGRSN